MTFLCACSGQGEPQPFARITYSLRPRAQVDTLRDVLEYCAYEQGEGAALMPPLTEPLRSSRLSDSVPAW
jgi:hypothetical protein